MLNSRASNMLTESSEGIWLNYDNHTLRMVVAWSHCCDVNTIIISNDSNKKKHVRQQENKSLSRATSEVRNVACNIPIIGGT